MWIQPPFALFPLVELPKEVIDDILKKANHVLPGENIFWLATTNYDDAPKKKPGQVQHGTSPPISNSYKSPFIGKKIENVADWIRDKPEDVALDAHHFVVLDKTAETGERLVMCRVGGAELKDMADLDWMRDKAEEVAKDLYSMTAYRWEEYRDGNGGNGLGGKPKVEY